jgi:hypothetical protein
MYILFKALNSTLEEIILPDKRALKGKKDTDCTA